MAGGSVRDTGTGLLRALRRRPVLAALFAVLVLAALGFGLRAAVIATHWAASAPDQTAPLAGWMTPRYVARLRGVPPEVMQRILALTTGAGTRVTLDRLAADRGVALDRFLADLDAALAAEGQPPP
jgi:hypothetical protein